MCTVQWRHHRWPWSTFQGQNRRLYVSLWKLIHSEILALVEVCALECSLVTSAKAEVMRSVLFVILSVCLSVSVQYYCKSNEPISLKLGVMIRPTNRKNWLTFGDAPVPDTDSASFSHFVHYCRIGYFKRFISISHTVTGRFSRHSAKWLTQTR